MTARTKKAGLLDELKQRSAAVGEANVSARSLEQARHQHEQVVAGLKRDRVAAYADGDERKASALREKATAATLRAEELEERHQGALVAANRAKAELDRWVSSNVDGLIGELRPRAEAATKALHAKLAELEDARLEWHAVANEVTGFMHRADKYAGQRVPSMDGLDRAIRDIARVEAEIKVPLPATAPPAWEIDPTQHWDDEVREPAQAAARAQYQAEKAKKAA